mmetsp:Transcript_31218/g.47804  ORF Transcript_31218/g.47804 Transcript_31218/m.47804 type:complete len:87 (+) Transcript_31218:767-1027(+)
MTQYKDLSGSIYAKQKFVEEQLGLEEAETEKIKMANAVTEETLKRMGDQMELDYEVTNELNYSMIRRDREVEQDYNFAVRSCHISD